MLDDFAALIVDESQWLAFSMSLAAVCVAGFLFVQRGGAVGVHRRILVAMNLFFAVTIGTMAAGHLLAVTTKALMGALEGPILLFYVIGVVLAVPSWWLLLHTLRLAKTTNDLSRRTLTLNVWLVLTLVLLGLHNLPLAAPGILNIGYQLQGDRRAVGWAIACVALLVNAALFAGSLVFLVSGQSFEQFRSDY